MLKYLAVAVFILGAVLVAWMGSAFVGGNPLALVVTTAIGLCYLAGIAELVRFSRDTGSLTATLKSSSVNGSDLESWLAALPDSLRNPVRLRIQGGQGALPMPVLTPYLTGLLVMLGMLGTFVGMVATLQGAVTALEGTTELDAIRNGLAAPIKGLGMAFGTSVAGVAASAALGFISTLCRRERLAAVRLLDSFIDGNFHLYSLPGYREQVLATLLDQSRLMPELVSALSAQSNGLTAFAGALDAKLAAGQEHFHQQMLGIHRELAESVGQSLRESLAESGRLAGESIRPVVVESMAAVAAAATDTQRAVRDSTREQVEFLSRTLEQTNADFAKQWLAGLDDQRSAHQSLVERLGGEAARLGSRVDSGLDQVLDGFARLRADGAANLVREQALLDERQQAVAGIKTLVETLHIHGDSQRSALAGQADTIATTLAGLADQLAHHGSAQESRLAALQDQLNQRLAERYSQLTERIADGLKTAAQDQGKLTIQLMEPLVRETLAAVVTQAVATQQAVADSTMLQAQALAANIRGMAAEMGGQWSSALDVQRQANGQFLADMGGAIATIQGEFATSAGQLVASVERLQHTAAANVERETGLHREQQALAAELASLTEAVKASVARQQSAVDDLTTNAARLLDEVGSRVDQRVATETGKLAEVADYFATSSLELASLGDALTQVVGGFAAANEQLMHAAAQLEAAIGASAERSDEQMGYYVSQAREVIDHSVLAQQHLIEQMRQLTRPV